MSSRTQTLSLFHTVDQEDQLSNTHRKKPMFPYGVLILPIVLLVHNLKDLLTGLINYTLKLMVTYSSIEVLNGIDI